MVRSLLKLLARWKPARWFAMLLLGALAGAAGTSTHRAFQPWGVLLALALVIATAVLARAWDRWAGLTAYAVGWIAMVQVLSLKGPGGDVLIPAKQSIGYVWLIGGMLAIAVAAFGPRRWFSDVPRPSAAIPGVTPAAGPTAEPAAEPAAEPTAETTAETTA